ncbi:uncharacterized protein LACBIDRAFT_333789 [Laccaria bicolor S238N-H82]|uniref:Predicted protein n=1 Tax=Laccaria bicolor (strain S238N-H82 / ATCC MYA-4686) TaxID=486041 RepID=B0DX36_LACBS|nr:uncharacterized protein LACBIDRAFT_333789 [Laccaria bicolor S238N-H82]EDR00859.1 predicted protein [Laccaria bicolor S238N-H82]|eukprot:XP_001888453.1 predicted protein [Laccaria bicolor S238N-H82]
MWEADFNDGPPLPPDASALEVFVGWPLPFFASAVKLLTVGICMPMIFLMFVGFYCWELSFFRLDNYGGKRRSILDGLLAPSTHAPQIKQSKFASSTCESSLTRIVLEYVVKVFLGKVMKTIPPAPTLLARELSMFDKILDARKLGSIPKQRFHVEKCPFFWRSWKV